MNILAEDYRIAFYTSAREDAVAQFRIGATQAANWLKNVAVEMLTAGQAATAIASRLSALEHVLLDWGERRVANLPEGSPWAWDQRTLEAFIAKRIAQWNSSESDGNSC